MDERKKAQAAESRWYGGFSSRGEVEKFGDFFGTELLLSEGFKGLAGAFFGDIVFRQMSLCQPGKGKRK